MGAKNGGLIPMPKPPDDFNPISSFFRGFVEILGEIVIF